VPVVRYAGHVSNVDITPRMVVKGADRALDFYREALGAELIERFADGDGIVLHSAIRIGGCVLSVIDEKPEYRNVSPTTLGGSPILLHMTVDDPDAVGAAMVEHGAEVVIPIADQFYGRREGRLRDPFGHLWIVGRELEKLSDAEIQRRLDEAE
jgi:PhnB protein